MANPLNMKRLSLRDLDDLFVLPPQQASARRKDYFERGQRILAAYTAIAAYAEKGRESVELHKKKAHITPTTDIRLSVGDFRIQTTLRRLEKVFSTAGAELTRQFVVAVYGNFEALLADHVIAAFAATGESDPEQAALAMMRGGWRGKLDRISERFSLGVHATHLRTVYQELEMGFFGRAFEDPIEFLQAVADLRHRLVHSSGRVDQALLSKYPECNLKTGDLLNLPFELPLTLWFFFVPLSEELDRLFAERFGWPRQHIEPELLS